MGSPIIILNRKGWRGRARPLSFTPPTTLSDALPPCAPACRRRGVAISKRELSDALRPPCGSVPVSPTAAMLLSRGPLRRGAAAALQRCAPLARFYSTPVQNDAQQKPAVSIVFGQEPPSSLPDPFAVVSSQLRPLETSLKDLVGSEHPVLTRVAQHFFELVGKRFRPTIVLLAASAAAGGEPANARQVRPTQHR